MPAERTIPGATPVTPTEARTAVAAAIAAAVAAAVSVMVAWGAHVRAQDRRTASDALSMLKSWIIDGERTDALGAASRIDYFMQGSSLGVLSGPGAEDPEATGAIFGAGQRGRPGAVIALRPLMRQGQGGAALALQAAPAPGRPCIDRAEGLMPLAMQAGEVRRIGFSCASTGGGRTVRGECEAVPDGGPRPSAGMDLATPVRFADDPQPWTLICRLKQ